MTALKTFPGQPQPLLRAGDRIRHKTHQQLTGHVKRLEFHESGKVSAIPYCVGWDDSELACSLLGIMFVYSDDDAIEKESA